MILLSDTNLVPSYLHTQIFTNLAFDLTDPNNIKNTGIIWASPDIALRKRTEQKGSSTGVLPFCSIYRTGGAIIDEESHFIPNYRGFKLYNPLTENKKEIQATRVKLSYSVVYFTSKSSEIVSMEKRLIMKVRKPVQLYYNNTEIGLEFGYQFSLGQIDESKSYITEVEYKSGILKQLGFVLQNDVWLVEYDDLEHIINTIKLNLYGYDGDVDHGATFQDGDTIEITGDVET